MDRILYSSPYIPRQWIAAHCMKPRLLHPPGDFAHECVERVEGLCTYTRAWISKALADSHTAAIVVALTCDQMRRAFEILSENTRVPCFLFNIPATWQTVQARRLYRDELQRLGRFLVSLGGRAPSAKDLAERMLWDENHIASDKILHKSGKIPLALAGPHAAVEDSVWLDIIARANAEIQLDLCSPAHPVFDRRSLMQDPFAELADACFDAIQEIFQRPNIGFYRRIDLALRQSRVKGLIVRRYRWCDLWHAEIHRLKQWAPVPVLDLEIGERLEDDSHRLSTRIQSFMEMMQ